MHRVTEEERKGKERSILSVVAAVGKLRLRLLGVPVVEAL